MPIRDIVDIGSLTSSFPMCMPDDDRGNAMQPSDAGACSPESHDRSSQKVCLSACTEREADRETERQPANADHLPALMPESSGALR